MAKGMELKVYSCKECGMTHYRFYKPRKCKNCGRKMGELKKLEVYQC